jgi:hypothetical protein
VRSSSAPSAPRGARDAGNSRRRLQKRERFGWRDFADARQRLIQLTLFEFQLTRRRQVLQHAAAAHAEMRAARLDAIRRRFQHAPQTPFVEGAPALDAQPFDALARQRRR